MEYLLAILIGLITGILTTIYIGLYKSLREQLQIRKSKHTAEKLYLEGRKEDNKFNTKKTR